nr:YcnI family protein [Auraticoccus cholistanensis]
MTPTSTEAGAPTLLTFSFSHGCEGSATRRLAFQVPEPLVLVTPTAHPGWSVETRTESLAAPVPDGHGGQHTERTSEIVYTAEEPVPDGVRDALVLATTLPAETAGRTLAFPVVQSCESGENAWVQVAADGADPEQLDSPAPTLTVAAGAVPGHSDDAAAVEDEPTAATDEQTAATATLPAATAPLLGAGALLLGLVGAVTGTAALVRSRR